MQKKTRSDFFFIDKKKAKRTKNDDKKIAETIFLTNIMPPRNKQISGFYPAFRPGRSISEVICRRSLLLTSAAEMTRKVQNLYPGLANMWHFGTQKIEREIA